MNGIYIEILYLGIVIASELDSWNDYMPPGSILNS